MEALLPYLLLMGGGIIGAVLLSFILKQVSIGIVGNCLTGIAGGFSSGFLMKYLLLFIPGGLASYAITGLIAGAFSMIVIGLTRKLIKEPETHQL